MLSSSPQSSKGFFSRSQIAGQTHLQYVRTAPACNHMHQHLCAHQKSQTLAATPVSGHTKVLHTLIGMGSAALAAAVPYPGKAT